MMNISNRDSSTTQHFDSQYLSHGYWSVKSLRFTLFDKDTWPQMLEPLKRAKCVVDFGAGGGTLLYNIAQITTARLVAVDFSSSAVALLQQLVPKAEVLVQDVTCTTLENACCDVLVSTHTIEHIDDNKFLREAARVLKPNGIMLLTTVLKKPGAWYFYKNAKGERVLEPSHLREYESLSDFLEMLKKNGFSILAARTPRIRFPLADPLFKIIFRWPRSNKWNSLPGRRPLEMLRRISLFPIPGYYSMEVIAQKQDARLKSERL